MLTSTPAMMAGGCCWAARRPGWKASRSCWSGRLRTAPSSALGGYGQRVVAHLSAAETARFAAEFRELVSRYRLLTAAEHEHALTVVLPRFGEVVTTDEVLDWLS